MSLRRESRLLSFFMGLGAYHRSRPVRMSEYPAVSCSALGSPRVYPVALQTAIMLSWPRQMSNQHADHRSDPSGTLIGESGIFKLSALLAIASARPSDSRVRLASRDCPCGWRYFFLIVGTDVFADPGSRCDRCGCETSLTSHRLRIPTLDGGICADYYFADDFVARLSEATPSSDLELIGELCTRCGVHNCSLIVDGSNRGVLSSGSDGRCHCCSSELDPITRPLVLHLEPVLRHEFVSYGADLAPAASAVVDPREDACTWPIDGRAPIKGARPCNRTDCPHCRRDLVLRIPVPIDAASLPVTGPLRSESVLRSFPGRPIGEAGYLSLLSDILKCGEPRSDRTGVGTRSIFGAQLRFDLRDGFPLLTTKKVNFRPIVKELLWFLRGSTNTRDLDAKIWDEWAASDGDLGPIYGHQWRSFGANYAQMKDYRRRASEYYKLSREQRDELDRRFEQDPARNPKPFPLTQEDWHGGPPGVDQIADALHALKANPSSRRIIVSAWNPVDVPKMSLPSCHVLFQFYAYDGFLDCQLYQRSADMALGVPFNIASYALLTEMFAKECGLDPRYFVHTFGDAHVYTNHEEGVREQLSRDPLRPPRLVLAGKPVLEQQFEDVSLVGYESHPVISFKVAV